MAGCSKVTETLRQEIMKTKVMTLSATAREVGFPNLWFLEYCWFTMTLIHSSPPKRLVVHIRQTHDNSENLNGKSVLHCSWNCSRYKNKVRLCLSMFKRSRNEKALCWESFISGKNQHLCWGACCVDRGEFTLVMRASLIYLNPMRNILFGVKLGKTEPKVCKEDSESSRRKCHRNFERWRSKIFP